MKLNRNKKAIVKLFLTALILSSVCTHPAYASSSRDLFETGKAADVMPAPPAADRLKNGPKPPSAQFKVHQRNDLMDIQKINFSGNSSD